MIKEPLLYPTLEKFQVCDVNSLIGAPVLEARASGKLAIC